MYLTNGPITSAQWNWLRQDWFEFRRSPLNTAHVGYDYSSGAVKVAGEDRRDVERADEFVRDWIHKHSLT